MKSSVLNNLNKIGRRVLVYILILLVLEWLSPGIVSYELPLLPMTGIGFVLLLVLIGGEVATWVD